VSRAHPNVSRHDVIPHEDPTMNTNLPSFVRARTLGARLRAAGLAAGALLGATALAPSAARADGELPAVGDPRNGEKLFAKQCQACHGEAGAGGSSGVSLRDSGRMTLIRPEQLFAIVQKGAGLKKPDDHKFEGKIPFLDAWDVAAYLTTLTLEVDDFFPDATHYVSKEYEIDEFGLARIEKAVGKRPADKKSAVFTFFKKANTDAQLEYVPQDPIRLDQLKKKEKFGYLVFLPLETKGFKGEVGIAMEADGRIRKLLVHRGNKGAEALNKQLSRFEGLGKKGQKEPLKPGGDKALAELANELFPVYLRAMESATMYDREENERTWADQD
jgi:mono/diheme cytochrome c family protein